MHRALTAFLLTVLCSACSGGGGNDEPPVDPGPLELTVDVQNGSDGNPGTLQEPFQSITYALTQVEPGRETRILVLPGQYWQLETFPLVVPADVFLIGDIGNYGAQTHLFGGGPWDADPSIWATVVMVGPRSQFVGFRVQNPFPAPPNTASYGVFVDQSAASALPSDIDEAAIVARCTIDDGPGSGVGIRGLSLVGVSSNRIRNNATGVEMLSGLYFLYMQDNEITGNFIGVHVAGGSLISASDTILAENVSTDLYLEPNMAVDVEDVYWDHVPPTQLTNGGGGGGVDIYNPGGSATIELSGAQLKP